MSDKVNSYELYFEWWLQDLKRVGLVKSFDFEPEQVVVIEPAILFSSVHSTRNQTFLTGHNLLNASSYTRDYDVVFHKSLLDVFIGLMVGDNGAYELKELHERQKGDTYYEFSYYYLLREHEVQGDWFTVSSDVKPPSKALQYSGALGSSREFPYNQKLMLEKHKIFVNKVIPIGSKTCLFAKSFTPTRFLFTDGGGKQRKINHQIVTIDEWMKKFNLKPIKVATETEQ